MQHPDKLVSQVFKARYYPNGSFLNAKVGHNPSYVWRSVIEAQALLKQGLGCRIGSGTMINILDDPWLPSAQEAYVQTNNPVLNGQKVASLFNDLGNWDQDLVMDIFDNAEANIILSIPVNNEAQDTWYWRRDKLGTYSVKSAYAFLQELNGDQMNNPNSGF